MSQFVEMIRFAFSFFFVFDTDNGDGGSATDNKGKVNLCQLKWCNGYCSNNYNNYCYC